MNGQRQSNRDRARRGGISAGFVPLRRALVAGATAALLAIAGGTTYGDVGITPGVSSLSSQAATLLMDNNEYIWAMEEVYQEDFNGDGHIGKPSSDPGP